jgi:hypothetical protein
VSNESYTFRAKLRTVFALLPSCLSVVGSVSQRAQNETSNDGFPLPKFELAGKLAQSFEITDCEYISGLTCRIHYNGTFPLPAQIFFTEFDERWQQAGGKVRLNYPHLRAGETGRATFRIRLSSPAKIVLWGDRRGPWRNPY